MSTSLRFPCSLVLASLLAASAALTGCSSEDRTATSSDDIYGYIDNGPNVWNTHVVGTIGDGQTLTAYTSSFEEHECSSNISMFVADVWFSTSR